jgi:threonine/homoserine/homoserine lactone efflux protein
MFHIAIAIVAIAVVAKRKEFWFLSMLGGVAGLLYFGSAAMHAPAAEHSAESHAPVADHGALDLPAASTEHH